MDHSGLEEPIKWHELHGDCPAATGDLPVEAKFAETVSLERSHLLLLESDRILSRLGDAELHVSALDALCELPSDLESNMSNDSNRSSSRTSSPTPFELATPPKLSGSRARQRFEIKVLRKQEQELSAMLARLQQAPLAALVAAVSEGRGPAKLAWKSAATAQRECLKRSQRENLQLRASVTELKRLSKTVHRMLSNRVVKSAVLAEHLLRPTSTAALALSPDDHAMFRELVVDLDAMQATAESRLSALASRSPGTSTTTAFRDWRMRRDADGAMVLDMVLYSELPFRKADVERAHSVLIHRAKQQGHRQLAAEDFGGKSDEFLRVELLNKRLSEGAEMYRQLNAVRAVREDTRTVVSSASYIDSVDALGRPAPGFLLKSRLWGVHTQHTRVDPRTGLEHHTTVTHLHSTLTAVQVRGPDSLRWDESNVRRLIIPVWDRELLANERRLENTLFDLHASVHA